MLKRIITALALTNAQAAYSAARTGAGTHAQKQIYLGIFATPEEAARAYEQASYDFYGINAHRSAAQGVQS